jgi:hypothetical protein
VSFLAVRATGHGKSFVLLMLAEIWAEERAREDQEHVEIWGQLSRELIEIVHPDGTKQAPEKPVHAGVVGSDCGETLKAREG